MKNTASIDSPSALSADVLTDRRAQIAAIVARLARKMTPLYSATDPRHVIFCDDFLEKMPDVKLEELRYE